MWPPNRQVSPVTPIATSSGQAVLVKLLGDLAGYSQLPVLRCVPRLPRVFQLRGHS